MEPGYRMLCRVSAVHSACETVVLVCVYCLEGSPSLDRPVLVLNLVLLLPLRPGLFVIVVSLEVPATELLRLIVFCFAILSAQEKYVSIKSVDWAGTAPSKCEPSVFLQLVDCNPELGE